MGSFAMMPEDDGPPSFGGFSGRLGEVFTQPFAVIPSSCLARRLTSGSPIAEENMGYTPREEERANYNIRVGASPKRTYLSITQRKPHWQEEADGRIGCPKSYLIMIVMF
jgi:hypothetical protein